MRSISAEKLILAFYATFIVALGVYLYDGYQRSAECAAKGGQLVRTYYASTVCVKLEEIK